MDDDNCAIAEDCVGGCVIESMDAYDREMESRIDRLRDKWVMEPEP